MLARVALLMCLASTAYASKPVKKTVSGCVVNATFFTVDGSYAYRFSLDKVDLAPFEGKSISIAGLLYPGDRFELDEGSQPVVKAAKCPAASLRPIKREEAVELRLAAGREAKAGNFDKAVELSNQALAVIAPPDCDTYIDRANVYLVKGDVAAAKADLALIKAKKKCFVDKVRRMNFALLEDLANAFVAAGEKKSAITAFELALAACDSDICKPDLKKALAEAKK